MLQRPELLFSDDMS